MAQYIVLGALVLKGWLIAIYPEFPYEQGPEVLSVILLVRKMFPKKKGNLFRIEKTLPFYSIG